LGASPDKEYPIFEDGMLLNGQESKGDVLKAFLETIPQYKFKKIIFVDNQLDNVKSVDKMCGDLGTEYVGIEYGYAETKKRPPLDVEKAKKQFKILIEEKRWVSDKEI
jgi:hypothetical protein